MPEPPLTYIFDARVATDHFPGIGRYASHLATHLEPLLRPEEQLVLLTDPRKPSQWQLPPPSGQVLHQPVAVSPFTLKQQWQLPRLLRRWPAAVYHSLYYLMPYRPGVPTILTLYDVIPVQFPALVSARARWLFHLTHRLALRAGSHFIAISKATRQALIERYRLPLEKITAVPLAAEDHFKPQPAASTAALHQQLGLPEKYVLYLGINKPHKNLERLIEAWAMVCAQMPQSPQLVIAGAWDRRYEGVKTAVAAHDLATMVQFLGPVPDAALPALYSGAELFVFPSLVEGFGLPVLEAMACGTAVACAQTSSLPEVGGTAAAYFDPYDPDQMAGVIVELMRDEAKRRQMAEEGLVQAQNFSWEKTAVATIALYRNLAGSR